MSRELEGLASLFSAASQRALNPVRRVLEKEAAHLGHYVRVALILQLPQARQNRLIKNVG